MRRLDQRRAEKYPDGKSLETGWKDRRLRNGQKRCNIVLKLSETDIERFASRYSYLDVNIIMKQEVGARRTYIFIVCEAFCQ